MRKLLFVAALMPSGLFGLDQVQKLPAEIDVDLVVLTNQQSKTARMGATVDQAKKTYDDLPFGKRFAATTLGGPLISTLPKTQMLMRDVQGLQERTRTALTKLSGDVPAMIAEMEG